MNCCGDCIYANAKINMQDGTPEYFFCSCEDSENYGDEIASSDSCEKFHETGF